MDLSNEKLAIIEWVMKQDRASGLQKLLFTIQQLENERIDGDRVMGYRKGGIRVTGKDLVSVIREARRDIRENNLLVFSELEEESEQW